MLEDNREQEPTENTDAEHTEEATKDTRKGPPATSQPPLSLQNHACDRVEAEEQPQSTASDGSMVEEQPAVPSSEAALPPEAQGETNGGPLGCCLGVIVGLLLSLVIAIVSRLYGDPLAQLLQGSLSIVVRIVMALFAVAGVIVFGYFGWKIGRKLYREYEPPVVKDRRRKPKPRPRPKPKGI